MAELLSLSAVAPLLAAEGLDCFGLIPLSACRVGRAYLLERQGISPNAEGSVLMMALPYYTPAEGRNLSRYAIPPDYHHIAAALLARLISRLREAFPEGRFAGFADHSPIDERHAAALAGLGVMGDHGLILTRRYSSYVFLCEIISDLPTHALPHPVEECAHCGACARACPVGLDKARCRSALTQKKGALTPEEENAIFEGGSAWGCDICQEVCPFTVRAVADGTVCSPLPDFTEHLIPHLTAELIETMDDDTFALRAYAWRGRETVLRNLRLLEKEKSPCPPTKK